MKGKAPVPSGATGREGTVTDEKIAEWSADPEWQNANVALRSDGTWIGIDVDAYGDKHGDRTLAALEEQLGELPATITSTARGQWLSNGMENPSRQHLYRVPAGSRFITRLPDIEIIQWFHRYTVTAPSTHPLTGERYVLYGYDGEPLDDFPSIDDLEALPEAWVEALLAPEDDRPESVGYSGSVEEWLNTCAPGEPSIFIKMWMKSIPQGDFGHDEMVSLQASLVNQGAQGEPGVREALGALRAAWLRDPYDTEQYRRDFDTGIAGAVAKFGAFKPKSADIPDIDHVEAAARVKDPRFFDTWTSLPAVVTTESLAERLRFIMSMGLASGLSPIEAAALAWRSPAAREDGSPLRVPATEAEALELLWGMAQSVAQAPVEEEQQFTVEPEAPAEVEPLAPGRKVRLLTTAEEAALQNITWWGDDKAPGHFMTVMHEMNPVMSEQYYHLNRWMLLSLIFANKAVIPKENGTSVTLIFYGGILGPSGTGKSESLNPVTEIASMFYMGDDDPDIGGDATAAGLTEALIYRDGKTSFFHSDEADAILLNWSNQQGEFRGMKQKVTDFFGGKVPPLQRSTKKDISGIRAKAYLCVHLTGVDERIIDAIDPLDWESGFVNRFVWARGTRKPRSREQKKFQVRRPGSGPTPARGPVSWYQQWVAEFQKIANTVLTRADGQPTWIDIDDDVLERHTDIQERFEALSQNSGHPERLFPTFERLQATILKCAALVAITERRRRVQMSDYLIALQQAEEWTENILHLVEATDHPVRARQADKIADLIQRNGGQMAKTDIHRIHPGNQRNVNDLLRELEAQGRIEELPVKPHPIIMLTKGGAQ